VDSHREMIWAGGPAREIMKEARKRFRDGTRHEDNIPARTALASVHWSLIKRYHGWQHTLAVWHMLCAVWHVRRALRLGSLSSYGQVSVVGSILSKSPRWFGGDIYLASRLIQRTLTSSRSVANEMAEMEPHDEALLEVLLGEIFPKKNESHRARGCFERAVALRQKIMEERDSLLARRQWIRVALACGVYFSAQNSLPDQHLGRRLLEDALYFARFLSKDQLPRVRDECTKHGIVP